MVTVSQIPSKRSSSGELVPLFLSNEDNELVREAINFFKQQVGHHPKSLSKEDFIDKFTDYKKSLLLFETLSIDFFPVKSPYDLISDPKTKKSLVDIRILFWKFVSKEVGGACLTNDQRDNILKQFYQKYHSKVRLLDPSSELSLEDIIFSDHDSRKTIFLKNSNIEVNDVIKAFNIRLLRTLLRYSLNIEIIIPQPYSINSKQVKLLFFLSKRLGLFTDITKNDNGLKIEIAGPQELIGKSTKYGWAIEKTVFTLIRHGKQDEGMQQWKIVVTVPFGGSSRKYSFSLGQTKFLSIDEGISTDSQRPEFDSEVEATTYYQILNQLKPWKVEREPVLIIDDIIILPDFKLTYEGITVWLEVVGFWTDSYLKKKEYKLTRISNKVKNFVLLVDKSLDFPEINNMKTFRYDSNPKKIAQLKDPLERYLKKEFLVPLYLQILKEVENNFAGFLQRLLNYSKNDDFVSMSVISDFLAIDDPNILKDFFIKVNDDDWKFIESLGLVNNKRLFTWKKELTKLFRINKSKRLPFDQVRQAIPLLTEKELMGLLTFFGYKIKWKNLNKRIVLFPRKNSHTTLS